MCEEETKKDGNIDAIRKAYEENQKQISKTLLAVSWGAMALFGAGIKYFKEITSPSLRCIVVITFLAFLFASLFELLSCWIGKVASDKCLLKNNGIGNFLYEISDKFTLLGTFLFIMALFSYATLFILAFIN